LAKSELFGYAAGAFTGALREGKKGAFEAADGGTLFLDEIGELPPDIQTMLLRVLQEKVIVRVGEYRPRPVNVRIIAATNRDLEEEVRQGRFREDLYFRLNVIQLTLPPLRERAEDVARLARQLLNELGGQERHLSPNVLALFHAYPWPGNVRELKNALEHACVFAKHTSIVIEDLPERIKKWHSLPKSAAGEQAAAPPTEKLLLEEELQRQKTEAALKETRFNISRAAKMLGISRGTMYRRVRKYNLM
jgi:transcriptional regulator with PAS, ATPase and Fis domain